MTFFLYFFPLIYACKGNINFSVYSNSNKKGCFPAPLSFRYFIIILLVPSLSQQQL